MKPAAFRAGYLPGIRPVDVTWLALEFPGSSSGPDGLQAPTFKVEVPQLSPAQMMAMAHRVRKASRAHLKAMSVSDIVRVIDTAIARLLDVNNEYRKLLEELLPGITGFDAEMVRLGLNGFLQSFRALQLHRFVAEDFANPKILDEFQPQAKQGWSKALGADLTVHVWAGNVPALPLWSMVSALLVKAGAIGKVSSAEPVFASVFARLLVEIEPGWRDCLAVVWWKGGQENLESSLFPLADVVLAYGGSAALNAIQSRVPSSTRFLAYGHKISFSVISKAALTTRKGQACARLAALDVARWDQQGCYSPHVIYVLRGGALSPLGFAQMLAGELAALEPKMARRRLSLEEASSLASWRESHEIQMLKPSSNLPSRIVLGDRGQAWCVVYSDEVMALSPGPLNRSVLVLAVDSFNEVRDLIQAQAAFLQTVGVAVSPEELLPLAERLGEVGATRICALGAMTSPEAGWHHDGRFSLLDLVRMIDVEHSAEVLAENFTSYES
jgi:Acyl-CoA reductase (LuxC)